MAVLLGWAVSADTAAAEPVASPAAPCEAIRVYGAPDLAREWADGVSRTQEHLADTDAGCVVATLLVEPGPHGARLVAIARDGRYAERTVSRPSALEATALGLLASIPREAPPGPSRLSSPAPLRTPEQIVPPPVTRTASAPDGREPRVWLGVDAGLRLGGLVGFPMLDFEGHADAVLGSWLLTLSLRYAFAVGPDLDDYQYEESAIGLAAGRRFRVGRDAFDLAVGPAFAFMQLQWDQDSDDAVHRSGSASALRIGAQARWSVPTGGGWRFAVTADADVAPADVGHPIELGPDALALPVWTVGLRLGASGEIL